MTLGVQVGLGPGHIVLDGDSAPPPRKGAQQPPLSKFTSAGLACVHVIHGPCLLGPNAAGWIKMPFGIEVCLGSGHIVLDGNPAPPKKGHPQFSADVCCGQTVAHLSYC